MDVKRGSAPGTMMLAIAGIAAPILFSAAVVVQGLLHPDYSHVALPISALAAWPHGWVQNVNFFVLAFLMIAFATGLQIGVRPGRGGAIGPALLVLSGVGILLAGTFPWRSMGESFIVPAGHLLGSVLAFSGAGIGLVVISRRMARDPAWQDVASYALASGIGIVLLLAVIMGLARAEDAPLHPWLGMLQRLALAAWFVCTLALALRLWRLAPSGRMPDADARAPIHPPAPPRSR